MSAIDPRHSLIGPLVERCCEKDFRRRLAASVILRYCRRHEPDRSLNHSQPCAPGHGNSSPHVEFIDVRKTYDGETLVVKNLNLEIQRGEFLTLLGP